MILIEQLINGLALGSVYLLFALGFTLVFGTLDVVNMAQGTLLMIGSFTGLYVVSNLGLPLVLAFIAAAAISGLLSVGTEIALLRPLRKGDRNVIADFAPLVVTIGAATVLTSIMQNVTDAKTYSYPGGEQLLRTWEVFGVHISMLQVVAFVAAVVLGGGLVAFLQWSRYGARLRAVAADREAAALVGVSPEKYTLLVFLTAGGLAGIAGVLLGVAYGNIQFLMGEPYLLIAFAIITVGGLGSVTGTMVIGLFIGVVQSLVQARWGSSVAMLTIFGVLFLTLLLRPNGLFGRAPIGTGAERQ